MLLMNLVRIIFHVILALHLTALCLHIAFSDFTVLFEHQKKHSSYNKTPVCHQETHGMLYVS